MDTMNAIRQFLAMHPVAMLALGGLLSAARVDYEAFRSWKRVDDALSYDWGVALWRWFQGAVIAAVAAAGIWGF